VRTVAPARHGAHGALLLSSDGGQHGTPFRVQAGADALDGTVPDTGGWANFQPLVVGTVTLPKGASQVRIAPLRQPRGTAMNLRNIRLTPTPPERGGVTNPGGGGKITDV